MMQQPEREFTPADVATLMNGDSTILRRAALGAFHSDEALSPDQLLARLMPEEGPMATRAIAEVLGIPHEQKKEDQ